MSAACTFVNIARASQLQYHRIDVPLSVVILCDRSSRWRPETHDVSPQEVLAASRTGLLLHDSAYGHVILDMIRPNETSSRACE